MDLTFPLFVGDLDLSSNSLEKYLVLSKHDNFLFKMFAPTKSIPNEYFFYPIFYPTIEDINTNISIEVQACVHSGLCKILIISQLEGFKWSYYENLADSIRSCYGFKDDAFVILSNNTIPSARYKSISFNYWEYFSVSENVLKDKKIGKDSIFINNSRPYKFVCLNNRPHAHRLAVFTKLFPHKDIGILTLRETTDLNEFEKSYPNCYKSWSDLNLENQVPKLLPTELKLDWLELTWNNNTSMFYDSYLHVVTETWVDNIFFSEKTFKPIRYFQPFVLVNGVGSLKKLKELGYKTFSDYIDESYDDIEDNELRVSRAIESAIKFILRDDLNNVLKEMWPILEHNYNHLIERSKKIRPMLYQDISNCLHKK